MIKKILFIKTDSISIQFFRAIIVGGVASFFDFLFLYLFTDYLKIHYLISAGLSFIIGLTINYFLSKKWIFHKVNFKDGVTEFWIFCVIGIVGLLINELFIWYFTDQLHMYYMFSKVIATFLGFFWNFSARKFFLFR